MISEADALVVAYKLAVLTFYLGVLVYALPIPYSGLKKWAPILIADAIMAAGLAISLDIIINFSNKIAIIIGGSWEYLKSWLESGAFQMISIKAVYLAVKSIPDPIGILAPLRAALKQIDRLATAALYLLALVAGLSYLISSYGKILAAIGVALYAVPFRIARGAGAWLLAFVVIFNLGLQALPVFVSSFRTPPSFWVVGDIARNGLALANLTVTGNGVGLNGELWIFNASDWSVLAVYKVVNGRVVGARGEPYVAVPSRLTVIYALEYDNVTFYLAPYPTSPEDYQPQGGVWALRLESPYTLYAERGILVYTNGSVESLTVDNESVHAILYLQEGQYFAVRYPEGCKPSVTAGGMLGPYNMSWSWRGVKGEGEKYIAPATGNYSIFVELPQDCEQPGFKYETKEYAGIASTILSFLDVNLIAAFILYWFTLPTLYLSILWASTYGIARLLGGRDRLEVRII